MKISDLGWFLKYKTQYKDLRAYLMEPVANFPWYRVEPAEQTERGRLSLLELSRRIQKVFNNKLATVEPDLKHGYLYHLHESKKAMEIGRYGLACHELEDVIHLKQGICNQVLRNVQAQIYTHLGESK